MGGKVYGCIYCLRSLPGDAFNREHVIPEAFGKFANNLVLHKTVCKECNSFFGENLELLFTRGSLEAIERLSTGVKPVEEAQELDRQRVRLQVKSLGEANGLLLGFSEIAGGLHVTPVPQVRFRNKAKGDWIFIELRDLKTPAFTLPKEASKDDIALLANSEKMKQELVGALRTREIFFEQTYEEEMSQRGRDDDLVEVTTLVDNIVLRSIAKYSFNYLAFTSGAIFALKPGFNTVRDFVRWGTIPRSPVVTYSPAPILAYDSSKYRQTRGHLVTVDWPPAGRDVVASLSLFNLTTYNVLLAQNFNEVWREIRSGHHFDIELRKVTNLKGTRVPLAFRRPLKLL